MTGGTGTRAACARRNTSETAGAASGTSTVGRRQQNNKRGAESNREAQKRLRQQQLQRELEDSDSSEGSVTGDRGSAESFGQDTSQITQSGNTGTRSLFTGRESSSTNTDNMESANNNDEANAAAQKDYNQELVRNGAQPEIREWSKIKPNIGIIVKDEYYPTMKFPTIKKLKEADDGFEEGHMPQIIKTLNLTPGEIALYVKKPGTGALTPEGEPVTTKMNVYSYFVAETRNQRSGNVEAMRTIIAYGNDGTSRNPQCEYIAFFRVLLAHFCNWSSQHLTNTTNCSCSS
jgi:hypothetical protein